MVTAIAQQNLQVAAGQIGQEPVPTGQQFQLTINTLGRLTDPEQFADIILKAGQGNPSSRAAGGSRRARAAIRQRQAARRPSSSSSTASGADAAGDRHRAAPRRGPRRAGLAAVRAVVHAGRPARRWR